MIQLFLFLLITVFAQELEDPDCGPNTFLNDIGVCQVIDGGCEPDINGDTIWCGPIHDKLPIILSVPFVFGIPSLIVVIVIGVIIWRKRK